MADEDEIAAFAASLSGTDWAFDGEPVLEAEPLPAVERPPTPIAIPTATVAPDAPPAPLQLLEAALFLAAGPVDLAAANVLMRGISADAFAALIAQLGRTYREQNRPYEIRSTDAGHRLTLRTAYANLGESTARSIRLTQPMLDVLALVAYRQPLGAEPIEAARGKESRTVLRQLLRLGLVRVADREAGTRYATTPRFLDTFNLTDLADLPHIGPAAVAAAA